MCAALQTFGVEHIKFSEEDPYNVTLRWRAYNVASNFILFLKMQSLYFKVGELIFRAINLLRIVSWERLLRKQTANTMISKTLLLTYLYLLIYIFLSSGVILYNTVMHMVVFPFIYDLAMLHWSFHYAPFF